MNRTIRVTLIACAILFSGCAASDPTPKANLGEGDSGITLAQGASEVDRRPAVLTSVYPQLDNWNTETVRRYQRIRTVIAATIDESGTPLDIKIVESEDDGVAKAVAEAFRSWRFSPALRDGKAVRCGIVMGVVTRSGKPALIAPYLPRQL